jgi:atypical dual specificity phosphatase
MRLVSLSRQLWNFARLPPVSWLDDGRVAACRYPQSEGDLRALADAGVRLVVNLHPRQHSPELLSRLGMTELHLPVADFTPPAEDQLRTGVEALVQEITAGRPVAVHCGGGLGRTGTLVAAYLVKARGLTAEAAIAEIRRVRPGSVETPAQEAAVRAFAER